MRNIDQIAGVRAAGRWFRESLASAKLVSRAGRAIRSAVDSGEDPRRLAVEGLELIESLPDRETWLAYEAEFAYFAGDSARAASVANRLLEDPVLYRAFTGHHVLGLLALDAGDIEGAASRLVAAGHAFTGQSRTYGPSFRLADRLVEAAPAAVLVFLRTVARQWLPGRLKVNAWIRAMERGERPHLGGRGRR